MLNACSWTFSRAGRRLWKLISLGILRRPPSSTSGATLAASSCLLRCTNKDHKMFEESSANDTQARNERKMLTTTKSGVGGSVMVGGRDGGGGTGAGLGAGEGGGNRPKPNRNTNAKTEQIGERDLTAGRCKSSVEKEPESWLRARGTKKVGGAHSPTTLGTHSHHAYTHFIPPSHARTHKFTHALLYNNEHVGRNTQFSFGERKL